LIRRLFATSHFFSVYFCRGQGFNSLPFFCPARESDTNLKMVSPLLQQLMASSRRLTRNNVRPGWATSVQWLSDVAQRARLCEGNSNRPIAFFYCILNQGVRFSDWIQRQN
jgi:hypothetical protein